jgi:(2Fe-2S) ferredoxin
MTESPIPYDAVVFVCGHTRAPGERVHCGQAGLELREELKRRVKEAGGTMKVRVCGSGCMDLCEQGPNAMIVYPASGRSVWIPHLAMKDLDELINRLTTP